MADFQVLKFSSSQGGDEIEYVETACVGGCPKPYRVDQNHPNYKQVREALEAGDRHVVFCYHNPHVQTRGRSP